MSYLFKLTTSESEKILRLPMYFGLSNQHVSRICQSIEDFFV